MSHSAASGTGTLAPARERVKVSFNLPEADVEALKRLAAWRDTTVTEAVRGAIATEHYIREAVRNGGSVLLEGSDGKIRELVFRQIPKIEPRNTRQPAGALLTSALAGYPGPARPTQDVEELICAPGMLLGKGALVAQEESLYDARRHWKVQSDWRGRISEYDFTPEPTPEDPPNFDVVEHPGWRVDRSAERVQRT